MDLKKRVIALGFFDGVHKGHGALLDAVAETARRLNASATAFTFDRSPSAYITGDSVPLLTTVDDRAWLMRSLYGIEEVVVSNFDRMMRLDWRDFITDYLIRDLNVAHVVAGHDFHFGYMGKGNPVRLRESCQELGIGCDIIQKVEQDGITISSTYIRSLIAQGEMAHALEFLGHPHILTGTVRHGQKLGGNTLGFPTVNLIIPQNVVIPAFGVYATKVYLGAECHVAVTNVGVRPTVSQDNSKVTVEGYLLDYAGDLYGKELRIEFYTRLRGEKKFSSLHALSEEIAHNADQTRAYFSE